MNETYHPLDADVIIIGAGVSGLTAAYTLLKKEPSLNVLILEATKRIGGRVATKPLMTGGIGNAKEFGWFDVGGQWLSSQQKAALDLLKELGIDIETKFDDSNDKIVVDHAGKLFLQSKSDPFGFAGFRNKLQLASYVRKIEYLCASTSKLDGSLASKTMEEYINENVSNDTIRAIIKSTILANCGVAVADLTVGFYIFFCNSTHGVANQLMLDQRELWLRLGAQEICDKMTLLFRNDIPILMDARVVGVQVNSRHVEIRSTGGVFYGTHVVVAAPSTATTKMTFDPPLPESKLRAIRNGVRGGLSKFVATYPEPFWRRARLSGDVYVLDAASPSCRPLLCCFDVSSRNKSAALSGYFIDDGDVDKLKSAILRQLSHYFGVKASEPSKFVAKHWNDDGSPMCCYKSFEDVCAIRSSTDRLFWAGAETSMEWYGSIAGAISSGTRAAHEVLYDLRPAVLTVDDLATFRCVVTDDQQYYRVCW